MNFRILAGLTWLAFFYGSLCHGASISSTKTTNKDIPDAGAWVYTSLSITGAPAGATVTGIDVSFRCVHPYSGDLEVDLEVEDASNTKRLWDNEGGGADNPSRAISTSNFNGLPVNNIWYLYARDTTSGDAGYIDEWSITIHYNVPLQPDLIPENIGFTPTSVPQGGSFTISYRIRNIGTGDAGDSYARMRLSLDTTLTSSDYPLSPLDRSIPDLDAGESYNVSRSVTVPSATPPGSYYVGVFADAGSDLDQPAGNDAGVSSTRITITAARADLVVENVAFSPTSVLQGGNFALTYRIRNNGTAAAGPCQARMRLSSDDTLTSLDPGLSPLDETIPALDPGDYHQVSRNVTVPASLATGSYYAGVFADAAFQVDQPTGNDAGLSPGKITVMAARADLVAENVAFTSGSVAPGGNFTLSFRVRNIGTATAGNSVARMRLSLDDSLSSADPGLSPLDVATPQLAAGQSHVVNNLSVAVPPDTPPGQYYVGVFADAGFAVDQPTGNDAGLSPQRIAVAIDRADLLVEEVSFSPASVARGGTFTASFRVRNIGGIAAMASQARLRLSTDVTLTSSDPGLSPLDLAIPELEPQASHLVTHQMVVPAYVVAGGYYLGVFADAGFAVDQPQENDAGLSLGLLQVGTAVLPGTPSALEPGSEVPPGTTIASTTPLMRWTAAANASHYGLYISRFPYGPANIIYAAESLTGLSHPLPSGNLAPGSYRWNLVGKNASGEGIVSNTLYFRVAASGALAPVPRSPGLAAFPGPTLETLTPTLSWDKGLNPAVSVYVSKYPFGTGNIIHSRENYSGSSLTLPSGVLQGGTSYRWNLTGVGSGGETEVSDTLYFSTASGVEVVAAEPLPTPVLPAPPGLISVANAATVNDVFSFDAVTDSPGGMCTIEASNDLIHWQVVSELPLDSHRTTIQGASTSEADQIFYRLSYYHDLTPALMFPLKGYTPYNAIITAVPDADESRNNRILYRGITYQNHGFSYGGLMGYAAVNGTPRDLPALDLPGYLKYRDGIEYSPATGDFQIVGTAQSGIATHLFYDKHSGYDYAEPVGKPIVAAASGFLFAITDLTSPSQADVSGVWRRNDHILPSQLTNIAYRVEGKTQWEQYHAFYILHETGYMTSYLHASELAAPILASLQTNGFAYVVRGQTVASLGSKGTDGAHLHFGLRKLTGEVRTTGTASTMIDPYYAGPLGPGGILWEIPPP